MTLKRSNIKWELSWINTNSKSIIKTKTIYTAQKIKLANKDFFSKWDQILRDCGFGHIY